MLGGLSLRGVGTWGIGDAPCGEHWSFDITSMGYMGTGNCSFIRLAQHRLVSILAVIPRDKLKH